ncbi:MAG: DUF4423 domain-containing protein [Bdellovibrionota bacterium]|nr:DUF4423 domain-containing protein [Bdellovibrionota bacterium]
MIITHELSNVNIPMFRSLLIDELSERCKKNSSYSLRAFSRDLSVNHSTLSKILAEKQKPSLKTIKKVVDSAIFDSEQLEAMFSKQTPSLSPKPNHLNISEIELVSNWRYWAFMELIHLDQFVYDLNWIAKSLQISKFEAKAMIQRLEESQLIQIEGDKIKDNTDGFTSDIGAPVAPAFFAKKQKELLAKSIDCIDQVSKSERSNSSMMFSCDLEFVDQARKHITEFRRKMASLAEKSKEKNKVYNLSISLFPLTVDVELKKDKKGECDESF